MMKRIMPLLFALLLAAACVPTPDVEPIVSHAEVDTETQLNNTPQSAPTERITFPPYWTDEIRTEIWTVPIRADVITSGQQTYPVRTVARCPFTAEETARLGNRFFAKVSGMREGFRHSASEYGVALQNAVDLGRSAIAENLQKEMTAGGLAGDFTPVASLSLASVPADYSVETDRGVGSLSVRDDTLLLQDAVDGTLLFREYLEEEGPYEGAKPRTIHPGISQSDAIETAQRFLEDAEIPGFSAVEAREALYFDDFYSQTISEGYLVELVRVYEYVPLSAERTQTPGGPMQFERQDVSAPWYSESIRLYVSDQGVQMMRWNNPLEVTELRTENVGLMPFRDAVTAIKRTFTYGLPQPEGAGRFGYAMEITKLYLSCALVPKKDDPDHAYLLPAWYIRVDVHDVDLRTNIPMLEVVDTAYYGFSALDGSYIGPSPQH